MGVFDSTSEQTAAQGTSGAQSAEGDAVSFNLTSGKNVKNVDVVINNRLAPYLYVIADTIVLADHNPMAGLKVIPNNVSGIDYGVGPDNRIRPNDSFVFAGTRVAGRLADYYIIADNRTWPDSDIRVNFVVLHHYSPTRYLKVIL